jgi:hypothetical protein
MMYGQQATSPSTKTKPNDSSTKKIDDMPCGMIYGKDHFLSICSPTGWTFDDSIMAKKGIYATFYRKQFTFDEAMNRHTIMYLNVVLKEKGQENASEMMKLDVEKTKRESPNLVIQQSNPILIPGEKDKPAIRVPVQTFLNDYQGGYESVAYIENDKTIVLIVISSVSEELLHQDYADFVKLVQSYRFIASNVVEKQ